MKPYLRRFRQFLQRVPDKIWFLPTILAMGFLCLGILIIAMRYTEVLQSIDSKLNFLALSSVDTSRSILNTLTGGLISLVVFSFSMVMVVLNQATSQFSPRLLPGLISKREHQFILGYYLGAIIYNLSVLARIGPSNLEQSVPMLAVLLAILFGVFGLGLFIAFINAISNSVRIDTILNDLHQSTLSKIQAAAKLSKEYGEQCETPDNLEEWEEVPSSRSGYFLGVDKAAILEFCIENELNLYIKPAKGDFQLRDETVVFLSKTIKEEQIKTLIAFFEIDTGENLQEGYLSGLNQLTEIAVKAMSPGINDPATALSAIDFLSSLLYEYLQQESSNCLVDATKSVQVWLRPPSLENILFHIYAPLRTYCCADVIVVQKMIRSLQQLMNMEGLLKANKALLEKEIAEIKKDAKQRILNEKDKTMIQNL